MARHVIVTKQFDRWGKAFNDGVYKGLKDVGRDVEQATKSQSPKRGYDIGGILGSVRAEPVKRSWKGAEVSVGYTDFRGIFFERGTYRGSRGKGVMAGNYLKKGLKDAEGNAIGNIERHLPK